MLSGRVEKGPCFVLIIVFILINGCSYVDGNAKNRIVVFDLDADKNTKHITFKNKSLISMDSVDGDSVKLEVNASGIVKGEHWFLRVQDSSGTTIVNNYQYNKLFNISLKQDVYSLYLHFPKIKKTIEKTLVVLGGSSVYVLAKKCGCSA